MSINPINLPTTALRRYAVKQWQNSKAVQIGMVTATNNSQAMAKANILFRTRRIFCERLT